MDAALLGTDAGVLLLFNAMQIARELRMVHIDPNDPTLVGLTQVWKVWNSQPVLSCGWVGLGHARHLQGLATSSAVPAARTLHECISTGSFALLHPPYALIMGGSVLSYAG